MIEKFASLGYAGPVKVISEAQCHQLYRECRANTHTLIPDWSKALAFVSPSVFRVATQPSILNTVKEILGNDVMLWGACFVRRKPGQTHHWHNDIETSVASGRTVSVWVGLHQTSANSSLQIIAGSHQFQQSIQEVYHQAGMKRELVSTEDALKWATMKDLHCELVIPNMSDGDGLFFDGWLWHASHNVGKRIRTALLLQYATPDTPIRIPDPNNFEWPFQTLKQPKPPCIMVSGSDHFGVNRIVTPPTTHDGHEQYALSSRIYPIGIPLSPEANAGWKPFSIFRGSTPNLQGLTCHVSALAPGFTPHPPHHHKEEEILMLLKGEADVTLPDLAAKGLQTVVALKPGEFVYYPAWFFHTITARGDEPANYLMLKWYNGRELSILDSRLSIVNPHPTKLEYGKYDTAKHFGGRGSEKLFYTNLLFQGPTDCLFGLQCHTSVVLPGGGYGAHTDAHDVAIITLKGQIESMEERIDPMTVLFFPAGQLHDMHNPGTEPAEYLVFEFHGNHAPPARRKRRTLWQKMWDRKAWKDKITELKSRFLI